MNFLALLAIPVAVLVLVVVLIVALRRHPNPDAAGITSSDRLGASIALALAAAVGIGSLMTGASLATTMLGSSPLEVPGMIPGGDARHFAGSGLVHVSGAFSESVTVGVEDPPAQIRWLLLGAALMAPLTALAFSVLAARLSLGLLRGRPFGPALVPMLVTASLVLIVGSGASIVLDAAARVQVAMYVDPTADTFLRLSASVDLAPWGFALVLALIATAFQVANRLQRETDTLV